MESNKESGSPLHHRTIVFGASGLLGRIIYECLKETQDTFGTFHSLEKSCFEKNFLFFEVNKNEEISAILDEIKPTRIVNCIGLTVVEDCEMRPEINWRLNADFPLRLAQETVLRDIQFIHISTDHYSSDFQVPRSETDLVKPVNQYGWAKLQAESMIKTVNPRALILRTNFFGHTKRKSKSILDFAIDSIQLKETINGFTDVVFSPVGAHEIGNFLKSRACESATGILNFASDYPISKYEFLVYVAEALGAPESLVKPTLIADSRLTIRRPKYLALNPFRLKNDFDVLIPGVKEMIIEEIAYHYK